MVGDSRAGRPVNVERVNQFHALVRQHPGRRAWWYGRRMGLDTRASYRILVAAERVGALLYEDDRGRLYPWSD